jgi:2-polyprenyl-6-methoxyphenol hydroxylase-like FAD-dependent oxidoreductase
MPVSAPSPPEPVVIVGGGPVGLALAVGLARCGVRSVVLERDDGLSDQSKAAGIHIRTREALRQWGLGDAFLAAGTLHGSLTFRRAASGARLAHADFASLAAEAADAGLLILEQSITEQLLLEALRDSPLATVEFGAEAVALSDEGSAVRVRYRQRGRERELRAPFAVGCDGADSFVRRALGLPFEGITYDLQPLLADVRVSDARDRLAWPRIHNSRAGLTAALRLRPGLWRLIRIERGTPDGQDVASGEVRARLAETLGEGPAEVVWASRFRIHRRASPVFHRGRVVLAGDAAHVHSPAGGLGMNGGIQDAHNLAWKLAAALDGGDTDALLTSYDAERRPVMVASVSALADRITRSFLDAPPVLRTAALLAFGAALQIPPIRRMRLREMSMLDHVYAASPLHTGRHRAVGRRVPNVRLRDPAGGAVRLHDLLPYAPAVVELCGAAPPRERLPVPSITLGGGAYSEPSGLLRRLLGAPAGLLLVRPDHHVAWAGRDASGLRPALDRMLGRASGAR